MAGSIVWSGTTHVAISGTGSFSATIATIPTNLIFAGTPFLAVAVSFNFSIALEQPLAVYDPSSVLIDNTSLRAGGDASGSAESSTSPFPTYSSGEIWKGVYIAGLAGGGTVVMTAFNSGSLVPPAQDIVALALLYDAPTSGLATGFQTGITSDPSDPFASEGSPLFGAEVALGPVINLAAIGSNSAIGSAATWANPTDPNGTWGTLNSLLASNLQVTATAFTPSLPSSFSNALSGLQMSGLVSGGAIAQSVPYVAGRPRSFGTIIGD